MKLFQEFLYYVGQETCVQGSTKGSIQLPTLH